MHQIDETGLNELRMGALTAMDGVWFMAVEKKYGLEAALEVDIEAWKNYGYTVFKRAARMLGIELDPGSPPGLETVGVLFETLCRIDGTESEIDIQDEGALSFKILRCPWYENLCRSGRVDVVPCEEVDNEIFAYCARKLDPSFQLETAHSRPRGDGFCEWVMRR